MAPCVTEALPDELPAVAGATSPARRALSPTTARIYTAAWDAFQIWCRVQGAECLPASPHTVAAYLATCASRFGPSHLRQVLAALAHRHRSASQPWPAGDPVIARIMADLQARAPRSRHAATFSTSELRRLVETCDGSVDGAAGLAACRDRALLLATFAAGLRRSELVALDHHDVRLTPQGMILHLEARALAGCVAQVLLIREADPALCAVRAMEAWLRRAGIEYGPVFLRLAAAGTLEGRLTGNGVWKILRRRAALAGMDVATGERVSPQALRKGFQARSA